MSTALNKNALQTMIEQDSATIAELKSLLLRERAQLEQREHDELPQIIARKDQLLEDLAFSAKQRQSVLQSLGMKSDSATWERLLEQGEATRELVTPWRNLMSEFAECKSLNEVNGKMIGRSRQTLTQLLNLLRGQVAAPQLYNNMGATTGGGASRCFAQA